jgi:hypothetical protein
LLDISLKGIAPAAVDAELELPAICVNVETDDLAG